MHFRECKQNSNRGLFEIQELEKLIIQLQYEYKLCYQYGTSI